MDVFKLHRSLISDYASYIHSFINIKDQRMNQYVKKSMEEGLLWPEPLIQLNPSFEPAETIDELVDHGLLHPSCKYIFKKDKDKKLPGKPIRLHKHQSDALAIALKRHNYVLTTGTGSGKSLTYFIPIVDHVLREESGKGMKAIIVYPMNALANSQYEALEKFLYYGNPEGTARVKFERYTGQESHEKNNEIIQNPPDILITNYVMLEYILTRREDRNLIEQAEGLRFFVLDELHTYRGRQGADVAMLIRRLGKRLKSEHLQCIGTSATLAGAGSYEEQQQEIAKTASTLFGAKFLPEHVIGETLQRATREEKLDDPVFIKTLTERVKDVNRKPPKSYVEFIKDPLSTWIESTFGVRQARGSNRLIRATPRSITGKNGTAGDLSRLTGVPEERCAMVIREGLLAGYGCESNPETGFQPFAFRLHQFISRGGSVYTTLEPEYQRHLTVHGQQYVPGDRSKLLFPVVFCRECGQEYYKVLRYTGTHHLRRVGPWEQTDEEAEGDNVQPGYLYFSTQNPWPEDDDEMMDRLPDDWLEMHNGSRRVKYHKREDLPRMLVLGIGGQSDENGIICHFVPKPFKFCLNCGIAYFRQQTEFVKLGSLASEGRSTATTILSLSAVRYLRREESLAREARKLLSFTDNRQDASLQAGHFNDFIETGLLRASLYKAVKEAGDAGLAHDELTQQVFNTLALPLEMYAANPQVLLTALKETQKALRQVLGYRLYRDLRRGWRITAPNLEQCGLLEINYHDLDEVCQSEELWEKCHPTLAEASPATRQKVAKVLLDHMRRELAIKVDFLRPEFQERVVQNSNQRLIEPWAMDEDEKLEPAAVLFPCSSPQRPPAGSVFLSPRSGFGIYLRRRGTFEDYSEHLGLEDTGIIINQLLEVLQKVGLVDKMGELNIGENTPGYQLMAASMRWKAGEGKQAFYDPVRFPGRPEGGISTNEFFVNFYRTFTIDSLGIEAREHTAQVEAGLRESREKVFKEGKLPILYCSPTMELGVDISDLNVVNMRNVPPTPANYAQRSGRAGRSGQPALIFTYCSVGSSHDQYFFKRPEQMVAGAVIPPRLDLANEDLIRAHVHSVWLAETGISLGITLKDVLDLSGDNPSLELLESVKQGIKNPNARARALTRAEDILQSMRPQLGSADWYYPGWLESVMNEVVSSFEASCERWRHLYGSALSQYKVQSAAAVDASRTTRERGEAERLAREAKTQLSLLIESKYAINADFYSYRYFAGEGFLPGYNFPRLPLSAYIPGRKTKNREEYLSRPRFLAISEFGPRAIVYHEGSRYMIHKVIFPVDAEEMLIQTAKQCDRCGYFHPMQRPSDFDVCEFCNSTLGQPFTQLFRLRNVSTRRRDRINSDEEERLRMGYEIKTAFRFAVREGVPLYRKAEVVFGETVVAQLSYGAASTLWRMNMGWRRRRQREVRGFQINMDNGYWATDSKVEPEGEEEVVESRNQRVIPFVEDRRNCLLFTPVGPMNTEAMASLQAALKQAVQVRFQLEDSELAVEPLPDARDRRHLLFYEAAEGGAGVLHRLVDEPKALAEVTKTALELCHFQPDTGDDRERAEGGGENCEAACYNCLMSYYNQVDHLLLDRQLIRDFLLELKGTSVVSSPTALSREEHLKRLLRLAQSELEKQWLGFMDKKGFRLPTDAQKLISECNTRSDFFYSGEGKKVAVYIDGPAHQFPERQKRDRQQEECLEDIGIRVVRFGHMDDWEAIVVKYPDIF